MNTRTLEWIHGAFSADRLLRSSWTGTEPQRAWRGAVIDSRAECSGRLFFAMVGENSDGHEYVRDAFRAGCVAVVIEREDMSPSLQAEGVLHFVVGDIRRALSELARRYRASLESRVVAITGSGGKTTTKEYLRAILRRRYRVHSNPGNYNNTIGVPLTVLETEEDTEYLVCEVGANQQGEVKALSELLRPNIGVITNIGDAHVGSFGSRDEIANAKAEMLPFVGRSGHVVLPRDDDYYAQLRDQAIGRVLTFGRNSEADFRVGPVSTSEDLGVHFDINGHAFSLAAPGDYNALNAGAAVAVAGICGIGELLASRALAEVHATTGRGRIHRCPGVVVIDESYNASPSSVVQSLTMLDQLKAGRRIAVLGDMKELGDESDAQHRRVGTHLAGTGISRAYWVGENASLVETGIKAVNSGKSRTRFESINDIDDLVDVVAADSETGDVILVKGSRACQLDRFVTALCQRLGKE